MGVSQVFGCCETYSLEEVLQTTAVESRAGEEEEEGSGHFVTDVDRGSDKSIGAHVCEESGAGLQPAGSLETLGYGQHAERPRMELLCVEGEEGREGGEGENESEQPKEKGCAEERGWDRKAMIAERLQVFTRDEELERQLKKLFAATETVNANENLLLSLRYEHVTCLQY